MANTKISALTSATTPLAGTEVLPIVQSGVTVKVASDNLTVRNIRANATTGILQVTGPAAASTRVATVPDANFTVARTDAGQTFTGNQNVNGILGVGSTTTSWSVTSTIDMGVGSAILNPNSTGQTWFYSNAYFNAGAKYKAAGEATWYQQVAGAHNFYGSAAGVNPGDPITFVLNGALDNSGNMAVTGNFVVSTSGRGIDFSATPGTGTSELLADYEEGTWTPVVTSQTGAITSYTVQTASYTKVGRSVTVTCEFTITNNGTGATFVNVAGLPFTTGSTYRGAGCGREFGVSGSQLQIQLNASSTTMIFFNYNNAYPGATGGQYVLTITYFV